MDTARILIVEDERIIALDLQRRLEKIGYTVTDIVSTGQSAVDSAASTPPDIIMMDIMLSGDIDGISAAGIIKEKMEIPVIFLTAYSDDRTLERAKIVEPYGYILKPFKDKELYTTIDIALYKYRMENKLRIQKNWMTSILTSIGDGIIAAKTNGSINLINTAAQKIIGMDDNQSLGRQWSDILRFADEDITISQLLDALSTRDRVDLDNMVLIRPDMKHVHINGVLTQIVNPDDSTDGQVLVFTDISEVRRLSDKVNYQAKHDFLTGLINRDAFSNSLSKLIDNMADPDIQHALLYLDLDQFKIVNEVAGHMAGDHLLKETTGIIKKVIRDSDECARLGGDEFAILLKNMNDDTAEFIAKRLQQKLNEHKIQYEKNNFAIKCSIGLVMIRSEVKDVQSILSAADDACYLAKEEGGNRIKIYDSQGGKFIQRRGEMEWVSRIESAIEEDRFVLYYQPIMPLKKEYRNYLKAEILLRMISADGSMIMPADFIPSAERYNIMSAIDRWVIDRSFKEIAKLLEKNENENTHLMFSINLCGETMADESISGFIKKTMDTYKINPDSICFEATETAAISNISTASHFINEMKDLGYTFSLDDFGSGFSSLNYLKNLPVDYLKIDGSFVRDMAESQTNSAMVDAINTLGHVIGIKTIAEFVGTKEIISMLRGIGVDYAQGYEVGKPQPLSEFTLPKPIV